LFVLKRINPGLTPVSFPGLIKALISVLYHLPGDSIPAGTESQVSLKTAKIKQVRQQMPDFFEEK
jgi:hypothetical protein